MTASAQDRQQLAAVLEQYRQGFATMDVEKLTESRPGPLAMPEEGGAR
jgi:hypothetical protein